MKNLLDREGNVDGSWVQTAFNEILSTIYSCEMSTEDFDKIIDDMGLLVEEKAKSFNNIKIDWQQIEATHYNYYSTLSYILDFDEMKKIISKSKIKDDEWDGIQSKEIPLEKINKEILKSFEEDLHPNSTGVEIFLIREEIPNEETLQAMKDADNGLGETISFEEFKKEAKDRVISIEKE